MYKPYLIGILLVFITFLGVGQASYQDEFYSSSEFNDSIDAQNLSVSIRNLNFFKNNEYFNDFVYSRALAGLILEPTINYRIHPKLMLSTGLYVNKYYGETELDKIKPLFRVNWQITNGINLIMGDVNHGLNHRMVEPIYQFDRHYTNNDEEGVQLILQTESAFSDFWVNYDQNSRPGDTEQEQMQIGYSGSYSFFHSKAIPVKLFFQTIWVHRGGQDLAVSYNVHTVTNAVLGLDVYKQWGTSWNVKTGLITYAVSSNELSPTPVEPYSSGYGVYAGAYANSNYIQASVGYWYAYHFISQIGEPLFQSKSYKYTSLLAPEKNIVCVKFGFKKEIRQGMDVGVRYEMYLSQNISSFDYFYGVHILVNEEVFFNMK